MPAQEYWECTLVVDGAVSETKMLAYQQFGKWYDGVVKDGSQEEHQAQVWEMFVLYHQHPLDQECECAQFVTSNHPKWTNQP